MKMKHLRINREIAASSVVTFMSHDRELVEEAYAGDIIGIPNHGNIQIGDSFSEGEQLAFTGIPFFAPELFRSVRIKNPLKIKQLQKGLQQLGEERRGSSLQTDERRGFDFGRGRRVTV